MHVFVNTDAALCRERRPEANFDGFEVPYAPDLSVALDELRLSDAVGQVFEAIGVKDVVLPGEMKVLLNRVIEAEKAAAANVILRREEAAATRSMANTAKVMADNPTLMRLKELESLKIIEKVPNAKGRRITPQGQRDLDSIAGQIGSK